MEIPQRDQLWCGNVNPNDPHKCNECSSREGVNLDCYRNGDMDNGVCIASKHCPTDGQCFSDCMVGTGCFGTICSANGNRPRDCTKLCESSNGYDSSSYGGNDEKGSSPTITVPGGCDAGYGKLSPDSKDENGMSMNDCVA